ncbi:sigma-70 family RNA polymerase sigma factor [Paenibacillus sp. GYB003]|uniref:sigma-70 family RNA polymerase sigma factor n=1 Tax=Paenibacillus sp. GYB003 TaxID=2994392 RepID=UPI002F9678AC
MVKRYAAMAYAVAYAKLRDVHMAEDAVQEAFTEAYLHLRKLKEPDAFPGWLKTIVVRQCARLVRGKRHPTVPLDDIAQAPDGRSGVAELVVEKEMRRQLYESVDALPAKMRVAVQLFYFHGYSLADISACLDTPVPALKKRLFDARGKLKGALPVADFVSVFHHLYEGGTNVLHIVNGDSVGDKLRQGVVQGDILVWREIYPDGLVFAEPSEPANRTARARYLEQTMGIPSEAFVRISETQEKQLADFRKYDEIVLWFEHDLFDQTMLCFLLRFFSRQKLGRTKLSLLCIGAFPGYPLFRGLGQLSVGELETLRGTWQAVGPKELELGAAFWEAYCSPDPEALMRLLDGDTSALPFARDAYLLHLSRFPSVRDGLGIVEQATLEAVRGGTDSPHALFKQVGDRLHGLGMGDLSYWHCLAKMAQGPHPLLRIEGLTAFPSFQDPAPSFRQCRVALTAFAADVLNGRADWIGAGGIDEWFGGVHLQGHSVPWRWDAARSRIVRV